MKSTALVFWLLFAVAAGGSYGGWAIIRAVRGHSQPSATAGDSEPSAADNATTDNDSAFRMNIPRGPTIPGFELTDQNGREFDSRKLLGKVWVVSYFFTSCPGPCYRLNQALAGLQADSDLDDVQFVSITCDPTTDTPEAMHAYAERFAANPKRWFFLTGDEAKIQKIGMQNFVIPVAAKSHSDFAVTLDRRSRVCGLFHLSDQAEVDKLQGKLRKLLAEQESVALAATGGASAAAAAIKAGRPASAAAKADPLSKDGSQP